MREQSGIDVAGLWGRLSGRERALVGAGLGTVVASFLPWVAVSGSVTVARGSANAWNVEFSPVTLIPAAAGLIVAVDTLLGVRRGSRLGVAADDDAERDRKRRERAKKPEPWWPMAEAPEEDPPPPPPPPNGDGGLVPPPAWRDPLLIGWALIIVISFLFVDTSAFGKVYGYWITLILVFVVAVLLFTSEPSGESPPAPVPPRSPQP